MNTKLNLLSALSFVALLSAGCAGVKIHDKEVCSVAGVLAGGADCAHTMKTNDDGTPVTREMDVTEFIEWLEPTPERGPAMCLSDKDYSEMHVELEQACYLLKSRCTEEMKAMIANQSARLLSLKKQSQMKYLQAK